MRHILTEFDKPWSKILAVPPPLILTLGSQGV
jgi:hypothetical protein